jgi:hypothetical protein
MWVNMATGKKEIVLDTLLTNEYQDSRVATILDRERTIIIIKNTNLSGTNYSLSYSIMATPDLEEDTIEWITLASSVVTVAGDIVRHAVTDPWDGIKIQATNTVGGEEAQIKAYINRK